MQREVDNPPDMLAMSSAKYLAYPVKVLLEFLELARRITMETGLVGFSNQQSRVIKLNMARTKIVAHRRIKLKIPGIILMAFLFISFQACAGDDLNPTVKAPEMVSIPNKNYEIGKYEVTQGEWRAVMGKNPSKFSGCGDTCPVEQVSWNDVQEFIQKLNAMTGKRYRLPTEAEWEYACYGGSQSKFCGGNYADAVAWYGNAGTPGGNSGDKTHPVGQKQANGYGLHDMSGNVWEWTNDCWKENCEMRVLRGGSWYHAPKFALASYRSWQLVEYRESYNGFRLARTLQ